MTARRPPAPEAAGRPTRTDSQYAANQMGINAPLIFGADLAKHPGWTELAVLRRKQAPQAELRTSAAINIECYLHADSSAGHEDSTGSGSDAPKATAH